MKWLSGGLELSEKILNECRFSNTGLSRNTNEQTLAARCGRKSSCKFGSFPIAAHRVAGR
jgi:hypothetical protein